MQYKGLRDSSTTLGMTKRGSEWQQGDYGRNDRGYQVRLNTCHSAAKLQNLAPVAQALTTAIFSKGIRERVPRFLDYGRNDKERHGKTTRGLRSEWQGGWARTRVRTEIPRLHHPGARSTQQARISHLSFRPCGGISALHLVTPAGVTKGGLMPALKTFNKARLKNSPGCPVPL